MRLLSFVQSVAIAAFLGGAATAQEDTSAAMAAQPAAINTNITEKPSVIPSAAATYAQFHDDLSDVGSRPLTSTQQIEEKLNAIGGQNASKLTSGWMSYSALVAAQDSEFAHSVRDIDGYYGRERLLAALEKNPAYVVSLDGGGRALQSALAAAEADAQRVGGVAAFLQSQERTLQSQSWIKQRIRDGAQRAERLTSLTRVGQPVSAEARAMFQGPDLSNILANAGNAGQSSVWDRAQRIATNAPRSAISSLSTRTYEVNPSRRQTANHMASLAAYEIIGEATTNHKGVQTAMNDRKAFDCFDFAQLQLLGCVRSQSDHYGLQACMRQHAISDVGECVGDVAK